VGRGGAGGAWPSWDGHDIGPLIGADANISLPAPVTDGVVTVTAQVGGDGFNGPSHFSFRRQDDLVSRMTIRA
jgi:hypothetical protein